MSRTFFDRLETELAGLARDGAHRDQPAGATGRHRVITVVRRGVLVGCVSALLAVSLVTEFPGVASGRVLTTVAATTAAATTTTTTTHLSL